MVRAVQVIDSLKRKPSEYEIITFFGSEDIWEFQSVFDNRRCETCMGHEETGLFRGNMLRVAFPDLEIIDADLIHAHLHPNCRCRLVRVTQRGQLKEE